MAKTSKLLIATIILTGITIAMTNKSKADASNVSDEEIIQYLIEGNDHYDLAEQYMLRLSKEEVEEIKKDIAEQKSEEE